MLFPISTVEFHINAFTTGRVKKPKEDRFDPLLSSITAYFATTSLSGAVLSEKLAPQGLLVDIKSSIDPGTLRPDVNYWSL